MLTYRHDTAESIVEAERSLFAAEQMIRWAKGMQLQAIAALDAAQVATRDGARSMVDWVAATIDAAPETSRALVEAVHSLEAHPASAMALRDGDISFDRAVATAHLVRAGAGRDEIDSSTQRDIQGLRRLAARHTHISHRSEQAQFRDRYLAMQPNLDNSSWQLWGRLPGVDGRIVEEALAQRADELPKLPDVAAGSLSQRNADALVAISQDSIGGKTGNATNVPLVTIFVDAELAAESSGETGVEIGAGPRVGPATLERILCEAGIGVVAVDGGLPVRASRHTRAIPAATRHFVLRTDGACVIDGCTSGYRLQPHHVTPWSEGGTHDPRNLATLCWYHHHVAIHGSGFRLDLASPPLRRRLIAPSRGPDPPRPGL